MEVSVIIPNYNGRNYLKVCLDSLGRQTFTDYETIIVDNNSEDSSCDFIIDNYPGIRLIKLDKNYGFSRAVNVGIKEAAGEYVVLLNNDTEVREDWLENLLSCIEKDKRIFSCCSKVLQYYDREKIDDAGDQYTVMGWSHKRGDGLGRDRYNKSEEVFSSCAAAAIYRKDIFTEIAYFDEDFFAYLEDVDISYRAQIYGYKNIYCSKAKIYHIGNGSSGSRYNSFKAKLSARNNIYLLYKNMPVLQLIINSPFIITGYIIKLLFFYRKGLAPAYLKGIREGLLNLNKINKVKYTGNLSKYIEIELNLIKNTFSYTAEKILKIIQDV